ncbi:MAG: glycosyltransferase family 4 protein [Leptothrix sp. (in: b-proteobacteria)]
MSDTPVRDAHLCFIAVNIYPLLVKDSGLSFVGGAEVQQRVQLRALRRAGYRISVITKDQGQPAVVACDGDCEGITLYKIPSDAGRGLRGTRFFYPRMSDLVRLLWRIAPDIVFMQTASEQVPAAALYARLAGRRFVFAGASDPDFALGPLPGMPAQHAFMYRLGLRRAHAVIVQNIAQQRMLKAHFGKVGHLIQNGYDEAEAQPARYTGHVLWAATVKPLKRPERFIELARQLPQRHFVMVGGPGVTDDAQAYFDQIAQLAAMVPNVQMVGHVPFAEVGRWFDGAAVCVNTSDYEGFPNTFSQAWLRGIPTLSFVRPESAPGLTGTLACADLADMVEQLRTVTGDVLAWAQASAACQRHFEAHHTTAQAVARYRAVFDEMLSP